MEKLTLDDLIIETTRRCNMECAHCVRGDAQPIDMKVEYIDALFSKLDYISIITFSGGEPSLKPDIIEMIIERAKYWGVGFGSFYIVTNGLRVSDAFLVAVSKLYAYCDDNEMSGLALSNDEYHDGLTGEEKRLEMFSFFSLKGQIDYGSVLIGGRANWGCVQAKVEHLRVYDTNIGGTLYLNCKGNLVAGCDFSYRQQGYKNHLICKAKDFSLDVIKQFHTTEIDD